MLTRSVLIHIKQLIVVFYDLNTLTGELFVFESDFTAKKLRLDVHRVGLMGIQIKIAGHLTG